MHSSSGNSVASKLPLRLTKMTTLTISSLEARLDSLGLKTPIPKYPAADVLCSPLDIGRSYIADTLSSLLDCNSATAYSSIQWPNNAFNGDLSVTLPKLGQGTDAEDLAMDLMKKVCSFEQGFSNWSCF